MSELTERLAAQARRFAESGAAPAAPRLSATVLLLRPAATGRQGRRLRAGLGHGGLEVYLQRRATSMAFASGMYAFPGGAVDGADMAGPPMAEHWSARLGRPAPEAWAVVRAAVREVAEETGVRVTAGDLVAWSRWITPVFEPRRYDTYFFLATLPDGEQPTNVSGEADRTLWLRPAEAVARAESGEIRMLPPTMVTLRQLAGFGSVDAALAAAASRDAATPILPRVEWDPAGAARLVV
jgi:8-oxo-dGTP pyrophosphatase MutT (NUDIX family)